MTLEKLNSSCKLQKVNELEFLDLERKYLNGKLSVDVYSKPSNSFAYVMRSTCYAMENIIKVLKRVIQ